MGERVLGIGLAGLRLGELERSVLRETPPYAVILFSRNIETAEQLRELVSEIKSQSSEPPLVVIDQEGGRVDRLGSLIPGIPGAEACSGAENAAEVVRELSRLIGRALRHFDIDVNLAPVVDIERGEPVPGLERRCYGSTPERVIELAREFLRGLHEAGVGSCLKHFPGLGLGRGDPHYGASVVDVSLERLVQEDLAPYRELAGEARAVMIGHGIYPQIEDPELPATLSPKMGVHLLREVVGFDGAAFSDDMEMHAVSDLGSFEENKERALMAGNDVVFFCSQIERMPELTRHIAARAERDEAFATRLAEAERRAREYRDHCRELKSRAEERTADFSRIREEFAGFCGRFDQLCVPDADTAGDRRRSPRTPGTGKTGREEWT